MDQAQGKRVAVLVEKLYEDLELWYPALRLREAGATVTIVGPKAGESYPSKHGYPAKADASASEVKAADFDAIIIPGGYSPDHIRRHKAMIDLVAEAARSSARSSRRSVTGRGCSARPRRSRAAGSPGSTRSATTSRTPAGSGKTARAFETATSSPAGRPDDLPAFLKGIFEALAEAPVPREPDFVQPSWREQTFHLGRRVPVAPPVRPARSQPGGTSGLRRPRPTPRNDWPSIWCAATWSPGWSAISALSRSRRPSSESPSRRHWTAKPVPEKRIRRVLRQAGFEHQASRRFLGHRAVPCGGIATCRNDDCQAIGPSRSSVNREHFRPID